MLQRLQTSGQRGSTQGITQDRRHLLILRITLARVQLLFNDLETRRASRL